MAQGQQGHLLGNRYRLDTVVGRGGMGTVWQAYDTMLDREVAVKEVLLPPGLSPADRDVLYERTFREARASARLNHPSVVTVHDVLNEGGRPWLVMEFVRARSLQDLIDEGPVPPRRAAEIGRQTLEALRHAHSKGILHRDVKPSNVLITDIDGDRGIRAVLTDFGIAQVEGDATLTQTGLVMGSPAYIPPERAQGERAVPASDLWALGATLYAAVEGRSPYERSDAMASLAAVLSEPVPPPRNAGPLRDVLMGLLARQPMYRMTADRALAKLAEVANAPEPRPVRAPQVREFPTVLDETKLDETKLDEPFERPSARPQSRSSQRPAARPGDRPSVGYGPPPPLPPDVGETVLDSTEVETTTRDDTGSEPRPQHTPPRHDAEARTLLQTDWTPPPPYNPASWQQRQPQHLQQLRPHDRYERERTKTIVIVTIAVILVVVAVLAGALILRDRNGGTAGLSGGGTGPAVTASRV